MGSQKWVVLKVVLLCYIQSQFTAELKSNLITRSVPRTPTALSRRPRRPCPRPSQCGGAGPARNKETVGVA
ncbi:hypothetical protein EVAR_90206_1 [Eumeta japonica]|uniref:Uncharacterized protein n=1 Tax=Eumeta variegata TaxID=151549 RepID=A0A4C1WYM9_EUMVA|nr:hypothetical protein EVAR_90206_1 [Eumeta japonica]